MNLFYNRALKLALEGRHAYTSYRKPFNLIVDTSKKAVGNFKAMADFLRRRVASVSGNLLRVGHKLQQ